jgi:hypothetical protein
MSEKSAQRGSCTEALRLIHSSSLRMSEQEKSHLGEAWYDGDLVGEVWVKHV